MAKERIIFKLEGPKATNGDLELSVFNKKMVHFLNFLKKSAKESGYPNPKFILKGLSYSSPAKMELEEKVENKQVSLATNINKYIDIAKNGTSEQLSDSLLSAIKTLAKFKSNEISSAEINTIKRDSTLTTYNFDKSFIKSLSKPRELNKDEIVASTVDGKLEQINIHNNANQFKIYDLDYSVQCKFPQHLLEVAQKAVGRFVSVSGDCVFRTGKVFPYKMNVHEMEILPSSDDLPTFMDIFGIAPEATGGKSSEEFVRELRDEWDASI